MMRSWYKKHSQASARVLSPRRPKPIFEPDLKEVFSSMSSKAVSTIMMTSWLLVGSSLIWAQDEPRCTNRSLQGDYGFQIEGVLLAMPGATIPAGGLPFRGVAMGHFDGKGNYSQVDHVVAGGSAPPAEWIAGSGPYAINPNCTGTVTINIPGSPFNPVKLHVVVVRNGKELRTVVTSAGATLSATTSVGIKVE